MMNITPTVKQLLIINVIFYIGSQLIGDPAYKMFALYYFENPDFKFWQPLTHMFMHAPMPNLSHILFNMFGLYSFGSALEQFWGGKKFLFFYISCGLGAALIQSLANFYFFHGALNSLAEAGFPKSEVLSILNEGKLNTRWQEILSATDFQNLTRNYTMQSVGASGAIYGLLVAFTFMFPNAELALMFIPIPIKAKYFVPIYMLLYDGFFGIFGTSFFNISDGVAHFAHLGGALFGFIMTWFWKKNQFNNNRLN